MRSNSRKTDMLLCGLQMHWNRKKSGYTFRLEIVDGIVPRKKGSAVARDLKKVLDKSIDFKTLANKKSIIISLNTNFELVVQVR